MNLEVRADKGIVHEGRVGVSRRSTYGYILDCSRLKGESLRQLWILSTGTFNFYVRSTPSMGPMMTSAN